MKPDGSSAIGTLTVALMLSGPHRLGMIETALDSIPIDSPVIEEVHIRSQGGPWNWGGALRERWESHPKVRIVEFADRVDVAESFNRTLDQVQTPWVLMLADDDYLLRDNARVAFEAVAANAAARDYGFAAFGWYYLKDGRYLASHVKRRDLTGTLYYSPKLVTTLLNVRRVRELGGFDQAAGGFTDMVLFTRLACEFDALVARVPTGVYRLHEGQESICIDRVYAPFVDSVFASLERYARSASERDDFGRCLRAYASRHGRMGPALTFLQDVTFRLRSRAAPLEQQQAPELHKWSSSQRLPFVRSGQ